MQTLTLTDIFGEPYEREGEVGESRVHGFENEHGSWSLYSGKEGWKECKWVAIRWKHKRKWVWVRESVIVSGLRE